MINETVSHMVQIFQNNSFPVLAEILIVCLLFIAPVAAMDTGIKVFSTPSGAQVSVDGFWYDTTTATFTDIGYGYHTVWVTMDGYQPYTQSVSITSPGIEVINAVLQPVPPAIGTLNLVSTPGGADIWVDNRYYGNTPQLIGGLAPGFRAVLLRKAGYEDYTQDIRIDAGEVSYFNAGLSEYKAQPGYGSLQIDSTPPGAVIYLDNNYKGSTPSDGVFDINQLTPGSYTLKLVSKDYQPYVQTVTVQNGIIDDIHATLVPVPPGPAPDTTGQINAGSSPAGANIYLDNAYRGITPLTLVDIPQGSHTIILKINGYQDWTSTVNVEAGSYTQVFWTLSAGQQPNPQAPAPQPTKSPLSVIAIISAIGICGASAILWRKNT